MRSKLGQNVTDERSSASTHSAPSRLALPYELSGLVRGTFLVALGAGLLTYVLWSLHWPMLVDSPVMHYVTFLMDHGFRPYSEITDNNMPGAYMVERCAMFLFGRGDLGWRLYDFFLSAALMLSMVVIARPYDWLAGVYAAGIFALRHGSEGPWFAGEREQEMTVLLAAACAFLFVSVRRDRPVLAGGFGFLVGIAASIKPTLVPFGLFSLVILAVALKRHARPSQRYLWWGAGGLLVAFVADLLFLIRYGALQSFLFVLRTVTPVYVTLSHPGKRALILHVAPFALLPLLGLALLAVYYRRSWDWERSVLLLAAVCGLFSYFLQGKGFNHHRYLFLAFALLLASLELIPLTKARGGVQFLSYFALLYAAFYLIPHDVRVLHNVPNSDPLTDAMEADLGRFGADRLQGEVQCFDLILGCLNSLYHLRAVENTGFTGDLLLFPERPNAASTHYQAMFWKSQATRPAGMIVMTNEDFGHQNSFRRLALWPEFAAYLAQHYTLTTARSFPYEGKLRGEAPAAAGTAPAYRIYLRNGSDLNDVGGAP